MNEYIQLALNGFFTGTGVIFGNYVFETFIRNHLNKVKEQTRLKDTVKTIIEELQR